MKKIILLSAFIFATLWGSAQSLLVISENVKQSNFSYGPKIGLNLSNLSIKDLYGDVVENPMKVGFMVGGFVNYSWGSWIGVQAELLYSRQGTGLKNEFGKGTVHLDYINIPILAKVYLLDKLSVELGPQIGFRIGKGFKKDAVALKDVTDFRSADIAIAIGAAYDLDMGVTLGLRYNLGLVNTIKTVDGHSLKSKNGVLQLSAAYNF